MNRDVFSGCEESGGDDPLQPRAAGLCGHHSGEGRSSEAVVMNVRIIGIISIIFWPRL